MTSNARELDEATCHALLTAAYIGDAEARSRALGAIAPGVRAYVATCVIRMGATATRSGLTPDDVGQEVLLRLSRWVPDEVPEGRARAKVLAWCAVVANNFVRTTLRRAKRHDMGAPAGSEEHEGPLDRAQADVIPSDEQLEMREVVKVLARCASHLQPPYDAVYKLALEADELTADAMAVALGQVTADDLAKFLEKDAPEELRVRVVRVRSLMDKWKSRMRAQLAECLEQSLGKGALPTGLRFGGAQSRKNEKGEAARRGRQEP
jgi:DNA-directed RNA polymerase specialized sigma24 family protein